MIERLSKISDKQKEQDQRFAALTNALQGHHQIDEKEMQTFRSQLPIENIDDLKIFEENLKSDEEEQKKLVPLAIIFLFKNF